MTLKNTWIYAVLLLLITWSCTTDTQEDLLLESTSNASSVTTSAAVPSDETEEAIEISNLGELVTVRSGGGTCTNVVIVEGHAYAACGNEILIAALATGEITVFSSAADDITADAQRGLVFTQAGSNVRMFTIENPTAPVQVATATVNFGLFSGISAAGCTLAISGGVGGSDTRVFRYSASDLDLVLTEDGIPIVDNTTGTPDVHVAQTGSGEITAFYSQDIGAVTNWAIQPAVFNGAAELQSTPARTVLTVGSFGGPFGAPFGPANFPVESEYLDGMLYVAHFAADGIEVIDVASGALLDSFPLPYEPTNISTDGTSLFVVGVTNNEVDIIDPSSGNVIESLGSLDTPSGVAASATHIAVADQNLGLVVIPR